MIAQTRRRHATDTKVFLDSADTQQTQTIEFQKNADTQQTQTNEFQKIADTQQTQTTTFLKTTDITQTQTDSRQPCLFNSVLNQHYRDSSLSKYRFSPILYRQSFSDHFSNKESQPLTVIRVFRTSELTLGFITILDQN